MSEADVELVREALAASGSEPFDLETLVRVYSPGHELVTDWGTRDLQTLYPDPAEAFAEVGLDAP